LAEHAADVNGQIAARPTSASVLARVALAMYALLVAYASWYPFSGWHSIGISPFAYLSAPLPYYWTKFDVLTNVVGYVPFGTLVVFALYPHVRRAWAVMLAVCSGALLSGTMEVVQNYLPNRVASNLDLAANVFGVLLGALAALALTRTFFEEIRLVMLRKRWF
jgi:VanZ family protein